MLRITPRRNESNTILELQGRLAGPWVAELAQVWSGLAAAQTPSRVVIDLDDVAFVDEAGQELLTAICRAGATLTGAGCLTSALLEDITQRARAEGPSVTHVHAPTHSPAPQDQRRHS